jgi:hypothetical protein
MLQSIRKVFAVISGCGFAASVVAYIASYGGTTMNSMFRVAILLHLGVFGLLLPMFGIEYSAINKRTFLWKGFGRGMPRWVVPGIKALGLFFIAHFLFFLTSSHAAAPEIINGEYVLNDHGRIVKVLTQSEYLRLKGAELRLFATGWLFFYFVPMMYWWFPRSAQDDGSDSPLQPS